MKHSRTLTVMSALAVLFFSIHVADDFAHGIERGGPWAPLGILIVGVWLHAAVVLAERRAGTILLLLASIMGVGVPMLHLRGAGISRIATSGGGLFFVATLYALGATAFVSLVLSARGLWSLRKG